MPRSFRTYALLSVFLALLASLPQAYAASATAKKDPVYTYVNLSPEKKDYEAVGLATKLLETAPDGKEILSGTYGAPDITARFLDKDKILIAMKINNDCGIIGCPTFIYLQTDRSKNFWVRAFDDLSYNLWIMNDGSGKYKIITQGLTTTPARVYVLEGTSFVQRSETPKGGSQ